MLPSAWTFSSGRASLKASAENGAEDEIQLVQIHRRSNPQTFKGESPSSTAAPCRPVFFHLRGQLLIVYHSMHWPKGKEATYALESTHCFMLLHHMHSELLLVHSPHAVRKAHGVRHCLALWFAEDETQKGHWDHPPCQLRSKTVQMQIVIHHLIMKSI